MADSALHQQASSHWHRHTHTLFHDHEHVHGQPTLDDAKHTHRHSLPAHGKAKTRLGTIRPRRK